MTDRDRPGDGRPAPHEPSADVLERIVAIVDQFEAAWRRGERPRISAEHLTLDGPDGDELLRHLLRVAVELRRQGGEFPTRDDYLADWPDRSEVVHAVFAESEAPAPTHPSTVTFEWPGTLSRPSHEADRPPSTETEAEPEDGARPVQNPGVPVLPGFKIVSIIDRGAMGVVYKAWQEALDRFVAIKSILPNASHDRFRREAKLIAKIQSPYVVAIHALVPRADGGHALVMEYVEGTDLARLIKDRKSLPLEEAEVLPWMRDVARGMAAADDARVIHRDLKPSNILIDRFGRARVADFGLGRGVEDLGGDLTRAGDVLGTPYYMAPEQAEDPVGVDTRADIYSFGATFYHALTGAPPFEGPSPISILFKHKTEPLVAPRSRNGSLSERTAEVLERCLAKAPGDRFASFDDLARFLEPRGSTDSPWETYHDEKVERFLEVYRPRKPLYLEYGLDLGDGHRYPFPGGRNLTIRRGDITRERVEAVVSSDDEFLTMGGGVSRAIRLTGGERIQSEARRYVPVRPGRAVVTSGGDLAARFVFHGVTLSFANWGMVVPSRDLIAEIVTSCLYHADTLNIRSIAFPLLGTGTGGFSREVCLDTIVRSLARALLHGLTCVEDARIVIFP